MVVGIRFTFSVCLVLMGVHVRFRIVLVEKLYVIAKKVSFTFPFSFSPLVSYSSIFRRCYVFLGWLLPFSFLSKAASWMSCVVWVS